MINRVLIVNDSHIERVIAKEKLSSNFVVFEADGSNSAYEVLENEPVDIIFLDNVMKGETGYDIAKELRRDKKYDNIPIVLMTSNDDPIDMENAFESGFNAYLHKSEISKKIIPTIESFENKELSEPVKVLVVDDSRIIRTMLSYTFRKEGFTVKKAENGEEAIKILNDFKPNFITMDVEMPGIDGFQTSKMIKSNPEYAEIPIIMITNIDTVEARVKGFEAGVVEYFTKPFEPIKLIEYVKNVVLKLNEPTDNKILVIEESIQTQHIISYTLKKHGYHVICLSKIDEIWDVFTKETFDLVLVDFDLGITKSYDLIRRLKEKTVELGLDIPIIVITSITNKFAIIESFRSGADDYISRPFSPQELIIRILTHLSYRKSSAGNMNEAISTIISSKFISALSHDLRSPLTSVVGTAELLIKNADKYELNDKTKKFINNILMASNSSIYMAESLIYYLNLMLDNIEMRKQKTSIKDIIDNAENNVEYLSSAKKITIDKTNIKHNFTINADLKMINKAVSSVLINAVYYSHHDSTVKIETEKENEYEVCLKIIDKGIGIKEKNKNQIFEPFFTYPAYDIENPDNLKHTGLGLPIAKKVLEKHGGNILFESEENKGTTFTIILPLSG